MVVWSYQRATNCAASIVMPNELLKTDYGIRQYYPLLLKGHARA